MAKEGNNFVWFTLDKLSQADIFLTFCSLMVMKECRPLKCKFKLLTVRVAQPCAGDFSHVADTFPDSQVRCAHQLQFSPHTSLGNGDEGRWAAHRTMCL